MWKAYMWFTINTEANLKQTVLKDRADSKNLVNSCKTLIIYCIVIYRKPWFTVAIACPPNYISDTDNMEILSL